MVKAPIVLFDLDGTLAETGRYWLPMVRELVQIIRDRLGHETALTDLQGVLAYLGRPTEQIFQAMYPLATEAEVVEMVALSEQVVQDLHGKYPFQLYPGVLETLGELRNRGFQIAISSNCGIPYLEGLLRQTGLGSLVDGAVCRGMHPRLEKWEFTREYLSTQAFGRGWFVGDSYHDMEAGRYNGLSTIFADYGYAHCDNEDLIDHRIGEVGELLNLLNP